MVHIILEQQVSLAAARTMYLRLSTSLGGMTPGQVLTAGEVVLRHLGLTGQKARYLRVLAEAIDTGALDLSAVARATDEEGRRALLVLPGIGPWTVDIYYLMALRRPDIWPQGDLALADALHRVLGLDHRPDSAQQRTLSDSWAPWRSIAARMFWQSYLATPRARRQPAAVPP
jgi:DNA-3-methyladenine glycosylase II